MIESSMKYDYGGGSTSLTGTGLPYLKIQPPVAKTIGHPQRHEKSRPEDTEKARGLFGFRPFPLLRGPKSMGTVFPLRLFYEFPFEEEISTNSSIVNVRQFLRGSSYWFLVEESLLIWRLDVSISACSRKE